MKILKRPDDLVNYFLFRYFEMYVSFFLKKNSNRVIEYQVYYFTSLRIEFTYFFNYI
jgi:hypothetical protein